MSVVISFYRKLTVFLQIILLKSSYVDIVFSYCLLSGFVIHNL